MISHTLPRIMVAAPKKSSGKTLVSIGLTAAFSQRGLKVHPFKKGADYIDPRWLSAAAGRECHNLDFFMMGKERIVDNFLSFAKGADLSLLEGNMGFFDGPDLLGEDCGAALANLLKMPTVLVVDCKGMARGVAALVLGHLSFPGGEWIQGIILNNVASDRHAGKMLNTLKQYCPVPVLGVLPRSDKVAIDERHLGLEPVAEKGGDDGRILAIGKHVSQHLDLDGILKLAHNAHPLMHPNKVTTPTLHRTAKGSIRVAYVADQAFHFYYPENLQALMNRGVTLVPVSLLADETLPDVSGLYIGGGFPEMFMESLEANRSIMNDIRQKVMSGLPVYAECGGLMVLAEKIHWQGRSANMVGALPIEVEMGTRPQGYGYMTLEGSGRSLWPKPGQQIACHEFHYSRVIKIGDNVDFAYRVVRGYGIDGKQDGLMFHNVLASYAHIHSDGAPGWADALVDLWRG